MTALKRERFLSSARATVAHASLHASGLITIVCRDLAAGRQALVDMAHGIVD